MLHPHPLRLALSVRVFPETRARAGINTWQISERSDWSEIRQLGSSICHTSLSIIGQDYRGCFLCLCKVYRQDLASLYLGRVHQRLVQPHLLIWNRSGQRFTVIFACVPNVAVNAIVGLSFLKSIGSIMDLNDSVIVTKVSERPFPIELCVPCTNPCGRHSYCICGQ